MILSVYDVRGIQEYVFSGNRLRENVGASYLVYASLHQFLDEAAKEAHTKVDWSGGGNAVVLSESLESAKRTALLLSKTLCEQAPGLNVACAHQAWSGAEHDYTKALKEAQRALTAVKTSALPEASFSGFGVTELCRMTGEPATERDDEDLILGPSAVAKREAVGQATTFLRELYGPEGFAYTDEANKLGRTEGERSYLGVIHMDGNSMGERMKRAAGQGRMSLKEASDGVERTGKETIRRALDWIVEHASELQDLKRGGFQWHDTREQGKKFLPVRPIVFGGDDITLVCDGRVALDLAAKLLELWNDLSKGKEYMGEEAHACAGVALVKVRYPFYRAYQLAEELCKNAKKYLRRNDKRGSLLDYAIHTGGPLVPLEQLRKSERTGDDRSLYARPYVVRGVEGARDHKRWHWFRHELVGAFQTGSKWAERRAQLHALPSVLREGREEVKRHLQRWRDRFDLDLPSPPGINLYQDGFIDKETPYLDAIEIMDNIIHPAGGGGTRS